MADLKKLKSQVKKYIVYRNREIRRRLDELKQKKKESSTLTVLKDKDGRFWWIAISSNAFRDKDGEIVSTKALKDAVSRADAKYKALIAEGVTEKQANLKARGPLRWWHVPGLDLGVCTFQMVHGRMLIEAGTFNNDQIAMKMAKTKDLNVSIGFRHPATEPDKEKVFNKITIFERSPTPKGRAANNFTSLSIKGAKQMSNNEKLKALRQILGDVVNDVLAEADTTQKQAEKSGARYKEEDTTDWYQALETGEAKEIFYAVKEQQALLEDDEPENLWDMEAEKAEYKMEDMKAEMEGIKKRLKMLENMIGKRGDDEKAKKDDSAARIAQLEQELATLKGNQPRGGSYRASMHNEPVEDDSPRGKEDWQAMRQKAVANMGAAAGLYGAANDLVGGLFEGGK